MSTPFTITPEGMPVLSARAHSGPEEGACVMELVSYLAGEEWTDSPSCTHPVLASVARYVNDRMKAENRHLLVPLIGRLFGTSETGSRLDRRMLSVGLAVYAAKSVLHLVREVDRAVAAEVIAAAERWVEDPSEAYANANAVAAANAASASAKRDQALVDSLTGLIDEYDRLTGRVESREVAAAELADLRQRVDALAS